VSAADADAVVARVRAAAERMRTDGPSTALLSDLLQVHVPHLRNPKTGRLDAARIAKTLGVSIRQLAAATPVTQQALSETPDSPRAQSALDPFARVIAVLEQMLAPEQLMAWLRTPNAHWGKRTPLEALLAGDGESVARALEMIRDGATGR
jgi:hypothetical protein